jgi:hypothetical protein
MNLVVEIVSDNNTQEVIVIKANSIGPIVEISHKEIDFGDVEVLKKTIRKINITNKSVIDADFYAFTKSKESIFKPFQKHYVLKPEQRYIYFIGKLILVSMWRLFVQLMILRGSLTLCILLLKKGLIKKYF